MIINHMNWITIFLAVISLTKGDEECNCDYNESGQNPWAIQVQTNQQHLGLGALLTPWHVLVPKEIIESKVESSYIKTGF